jgi:hypothetical protein
VLAAAWRRVLAEDAGVFTPVASHPATVRALVAAHRELREVDDAALEAIARSGGPVAAGLVGLHRRVVALLAGSWYDVTDLRVAAAAAPALADLGVVVLFLPQDLPPSATRLVAVLTQQSGLQVVAGLTGDARADAGVLRSIPIDPGPVPDVEPATATRVVHASDADDEVACVVRLVVDRLADTPAHRVAVLYGAAQPYARLLAEHLAAAGITTNGAAVRPTIERSLPRILLSVLALPAHDWRRDEVLAVLGGAPVREETGQRIPASRWERISRAAGVVGGQDWQARLEWYAAREREQPAPSADAVGCRGFGTGGYHKFRIAIASADAAG